MPPAGEPLAPAGRGFYAPLGYVQNVKKSTPTETANRSGDALLQMLPNFYLAKLLTGNRVCVFISSPPEFGFAWRGANSYGDDIKTQKAFGRLIRYRLMSFSEVSYDVFF